MASKLFPPALESLSPRPGSRQRAAHVLRRGMEAGVLAMVCLSPWFFGGTEPEFECILDAGAAVLLAFWGARILLKGELGWQKCPVALCLAALTLLAVWQLTPLPRDLLGWLSPATARLYEQLLPLQAEVLPFGEAREEPVAATGATLSLYPGRTRQELIRLLAVLSLFVIVRNNVAAPGSLRRLSIAALINGVLLSLFALFQFFSSPTDTVYWTWPAEGTVFGPFVCRNHFAFYINMCVGLGVGLLLGCRYFATARQRRNRGPIRVDTVENPGGFAHAGLPHPAAETGAYVGLNDPKNAPWADARLTLLQDSAALWVIGALALMISSVLFCASRGGIVALLGGSMVLLLSNLKRSVRFRRVGAIVLILSIVLGLVTWFGFDRVQARLATLGGNEILQEGRLHLWSRLLPLAKDFLVWGTGYGTFQYLEPLRRSDATDETVCSNAENDYLEGQVEGGLVRLVLSLLAVGLVFRLGYRAVHHPLTLPSPPEAGGEGRALTLPSPPQAGGEGRVRGASGLALGVLFGFTTMAVQSFVDFGLHIPAIAVLATVMCAQLCAAGSTRAGTIESGRQAVAAIRRNESGASNVYPLRLSGLAPLAGAALAVLVGLLLSYEAWRSYQLQEFRLAGSSAGSFTCLAGQQHRIDSLAAAARLAPQSARLQIELALVHYDVYQEQRQKLRTRDRLSDAVQVIGDLMPTRLSILVTHPTLTLPPAWVFYSRARMELSTQIDDQITRQHLVPALRAFLQARDLCPLLPEPQRFLADNVEELEQADKRSAYLERATLVVPYDPGLWYVQGEELLERQPDQAWKKWRWSLELSDLYLAPILEHCTQRLDPQEILDRVLPAEPSILLAAALQLYPEPTEQRELFLGRALALLEKRSAPVSARDLRVKASIYAALGQSDETLRAYQAALALEPRAVTWRFEYARLLQEQRCLQQARRELLTVLSQQPEHAPAHELLAIVERQIAEGL